MRIKELSEKYHLDSRTIDYYSNVAKILPYKQPNVSNNYRDYDEESERVLKKILILRGIGLPIEQIRTALQNPNYFSMERLDEHIEILKKKREEEINRYNECIDFAETLKKAKLRPLEVIGDYKLDAPVELLTFIMAQTDEIDESVQALLAKERYQEFNDSVVSFFFRISQHHNMPYDSDDVQEIIRQFVTRLNNKPGLVIALFIDGQASQHPNIFNTLFEYEDEDEDIERFFSQILMICSDWCADEKSREKILNEDRFKSVHESEIIPLEQSFQELFETEGHTVVDLIMYLLSSFLDQDLVTVLLGIVLAADMHADTYTAAYDKQFGDGFYKFLRNALLYYINQNNIEINQALQGMA